MIYVFPCRKRSLIGRYLMWLPVLIQTWILHPDLGLSNATKWANESLSPPNHCSEIEAKYAIS